MGFRIRRKLIADPEFLALPPEAREAFVSVFRELAVSETALLRGPRFFIEELRQRQRIAREGIYSVHVLEPGSRRWLWRGVSFRRGTDLVFFAFGPRRPDFYKRMARAREAVSRLDDEN